MALAHAGYAIGNDARLRILLAVFEATNDGRPPTRAELAERTGLPNGSISHHIPRLVKGELLETLGGTRALRLAKKGIHALAHEGLIEPVAHEPVYGLTAKGTKLLETAPKAAQ